MGGASSIADAPKEILNELKCFYCGELLTCPPVMLYIEYGNICGRCPILETHGKYVRNKAYENAVKLHYFPCKYRNKGCASSLKWGEVMDHESTCYYRQYRCPSMPFMCEWTGYRYEFYYHYIKMHKDIFYNEDEPLKFNMNADYNQNIYLYTIKRPFILHVSYHRRKRNFGCCLIYLEEPADNYEYEFKIEFLTETKDTFSFRGTYNNCISSNFPDIREYLVQPVAFTPSSDAMKTINLQSFMEHFGNNPTIRFKISVQWKYVL